MKILGKELNFNGKKIYHEGNKPTASEIGAATTSHTHNYAGASSAGGNANAAVKLATARTINGTSFNGSANITTANWGTARTITIGNTSKSVNGSGNVSWSLSEIGAANISDTTTTTSSVWSSSKTQTQINSSYNTMTKRVEALEETMYSDFIMKSGDTMTGDLSIKRSDGGASKIKVYRTISSKEMEASLDIYNENGGSASLSTWDRTGNVQTGSYIFGGNALWADNTSSGTRPDLGKSSHRFGKAWFDRLDAVNGIYTAGNLIVNGGTTYLWSTILENNHSLYGKKTDGTNIINICGIDTSNNIYLGWGNETYINVNNTMRAYRDIHVQNGAVMRVTGQLNVARTTDHVQLALFQTSGDSNASGDGQTHIGYYQASLGGYTHYFRGGGPVIIDNKQSLQVANNWIKLAAKKLTMSSSTPSGAVAGDVWIQI